MKKNISGNENAKGPRSSSLVRASLTSSKFMPGQRPIFVIGDLITSKRTKKSSFGTVKVFQMQFVSRSGKIFSIFSLLINNFAPIVCLTLCPTSERRSTSYFLAPNYCPISPFLAIFGHRAPNQANLLPISAEFFLISRKISRQMNCNPDHRPRKETGFFLHFSKSKSTSIAN